MPVVECDVEVARERLVDAGASLEPGNTDHEAWRARLGDATAVAYEGKVVVQGADPHRIVAVLRDGGGRAHLYFDGASRGNPGPAAIGWVLVNGDGIVAEGGERIGRATNNQAEYAALLRGLEVAADYGFDELQIRGDAQLIVKQVRGEWNANDPTLREKRVSVLERLADLEQWHIEHVPREVNERADELANEVLDAA